MTTSHDTLLQPGDNRLIAYRHTDDTGWVMDPAPVKRDWMEATTGRFAYRCLPLVIANQSGWVIRSPGTLAVKWTGAVGVDALTLRFIDAPNSFQRLVMSNFGHGIVSFLLPWVFRTPPGVSLLVRGAANHWVTNAHPLQGVVETDWLSTTFTMNWQITARNKEVWFRKGDPLCMLTPIRLDLIEEITPEIRDLTSYPALAREVGEFSAKRGKTRVESFEKFKGGEEKFQLFELDYMRGKTAVGEKAETHRTNVKIKPFEKH